MDKNPFAEINARLERQEKILLDLSKKPIEPSPENSYIAPLDLCRMFGVSRTTITNWTNEGILKKYSIGGRIRYLLSEVNEAVTLVE